MVNSSKAVITLPTDKELLITREFDAPRHLVYRAWTTPELIKRWWAGDHGEVTIAEFDLRVGGRWRYVMTAHGGLEVAFHGEYREIVPNERIVSTEVYEAMPDGEALDITTFTEKDRRTTLTILMQLASKDDRDMVIKSGMEAGMQEQMEHLDKILVSLR